MHIAQGVRLFEIFDFFHIVVKNKMHAVAPNIGYFKYIILKFKTFTYDNNSKIIYSFCMCGADIPPCKKGPTRGRVVTLKTGRQQVPG